MASALASPPPLGSGGSSDLKANARKFLERALLISALFHLAAVGVFRAAEERFATTDEEIPVVSGHWTPPAVVIPHIDPISWRWRPPTTPPPKAGVYLAVRKPDFPRLIDGEPGVSGYDPVQTDPKGSPGRENPGGEPPEPTSPFTYADTPPVPIVAPRPAYPPWAREAGIEGKVLVRVLVGTDGIPKNAVIVSGPRGLTDGVVDAVLRWRFKPGLANKEPVEVWVAIPITFRLGE